MSAFGSTTGANLRQVGGDHYGPGSVMQHWDFTVRVLNNRYLEGQITRYVCRHFNKNGAEDLEKALHYTAKLMEEFNAGRVEPLICNGFSKGQLAELDTFVRALPFEEGSIVSAIALYASEYSLEIAYMRLASLLSQRYGKAVLPPGALAVQGQPAEAPGEAATEILPHVLPHGLERRVPRHD